MRLYAGYIRKSPSVKMKIQKKTNPNAKSSSLSTQQDSIERWQAARELPEIKTWYVDDEVSARKTPLQDRPEGAKMLSAIRKREITDVVVARPDRLFRDVANGLTVLKDWQKKGVVLHCANGVVIDISTATGYLIAVFLLGVTDFEARYIAERTRDSKLHQQRSGQVISKCPPYGQKRLDCGTVITDPDEQAAIQQIAQWYDSGVNISRITSQCNELKLPCRGKRWHHSTVERVLRRHQEVIPKNGISTSQ